MLFNNTVFLIEIVILLCYSNHVLHLIANSEECFMKCPYCQKEMQSGYLQSSRALAWDTEILSDFVIPSKDRGGFSVTKGIFADHAIKADFCNQCGIFISHLQKK